MENNPLVLLCLIAVGAYITKLWFDDYKAAVAGSPAKAPLPGAVPAPRRALWIALAGAWILLALETWGEIALGVSSEQSTLVWLFAVYTLFAGVIEEIIFRGYLVVERRGPAALWGGVFAASLLFALLHPHVWSWEDSKLTFDFGAKALFTTAVLFVSSLWFYFVRFAAFNPGRSLLPCFAAHIGKNLGVIGVKLAQGHMGGLW